MKNSKEVEKKSNWVEKKEADMQPIIGGMEIVLVLKEIEMYNKMEVVNK